MAHTPKPHDLRRKKKANALEKKPVPPTFDQVQDMVRALSDVQTGKQPGLIIVPAERGYYAQFADGQKPFSLMNGRIASGATPAEAISNLVGF